MGSSLVGDVKCSTSHGASRPKRRGCRSGDLELVLEHGKEIGAAVVLTEPATQGEVTGLKPRVAAQKRIAGTAAVMAGGVVVTAYRRPAERTRILIAVKPPSTRRPTRIRSGHNPSVSSAP